MKRMSSTSRTIFFQFHPLRIISSTLVGVVSSLSAVGTAKSDKYSVFSSTGHIYFLRFYEKQPDQTVYPDLAKI